MVPSAPNAKACDVDGEDDYAFVLKLPVCRELGPTCALPAPGTTVTASYAVTDGAQGDVDVKVVRHAKPYLALQIGPKRRRRGLDRW